MCRTGAAENRKEAWSLPLVLGGQTFGKWVVCTGENLAHPILLRRSRWMSTFAAIPGSELCDGGIFCGDREERGDLIISIPFWHPFKRNYSVLCPWEGLWEGQDTMWQRDNRTTHIRLKNNCKKTNEMNDSSCAQTKGTETKYSK